MRASDFDICEYLWDELPKEPDAAHITYTIQDIDLLWHTGFVDTEAHTLETWRRVFAAYKQGKDTYVLSKAEFMTLDEYRYKGLIYAPFEANRINEGQYTDEGFQQLVDGSILPSTSLSRAELQKEIDAQKKKHRLANDMINVEKNMKRSIATILEHFPSPLRRLELLYATIFASDCLDWSEKLEEPFEIARAEISTFTMLSANTTEKKLKGLQALQKARLPDGIPKMDTEEAQAKAPEGVSLHSIRRTRRGVKT